VLENSLSYGLREMPIGYNAL